MNADTLCTNCGKYYISSPFASVTRCPVCGHERTVGATKRYDGTNWSISPESAYYALDGPPEKVKAHLAKIKRAALEAIADGHAWADDLAAECDRYLGEL